MSLRPPTLWPAALMTAAALAGAAAAAGDGTQPDAFPGVLDEHPRIRYASRPTRDPVSMLKDAVSRKSISLTYEPASGYLRPVLEALDVAAESQVLVFSKTGVQRLSTGPRNPRAIFFNDSVVVGYIPGARVLELAAHDPEQGVVFHTIDQTIASAPSIERRTNCLACHVSGATLGVPGMIARSNFVTAEGDTLPQLGSFDVDHRTPVLQRWGGWFVIGHDPTPQFPAVPHMGNVTVSSHDASRPVALSNQVLVDWLGMHSDARGYPSSNSDLVALMLFDHQMRAINLLTRLNWEFRVSDPGGATAPLTATVVDLVGELVDYLLFVDEAAPPKNALPRGGFASRFVARGPVDRHGRSLRQLDFGRRLLRYSCSYMIYTPAFDALPLPVKHGVYERMGSVLSGRDKRPRYAHLSAADRQAISEILRETLPEISQVWDLTR